MYKYHVVNSYFYQKVLRAKNKEKTLEKLSKNKI